MTYELNNERKETCRNCGLSDYGCTEAYTEGRPLNRDVNQCSELYLDTHPIMGKAISQGLGTLIR